MPSLPPRMCCVPGCTAYAIAGKGRCAAHARKPLTDYREKTNAMYKTGRWREKRRRQLDREPLCRECRKEHKLTQATEVDHIVPHKGDKTLFFDDHNLQSLCHKCHSIKTARENAGNERYWW